jgi:quinol monooxygenase YgiN
MHARIGTFETASDRLDRVVTFLRERAVAAFSAHEGFLGYQAWVDRERGRIVGISLWTTRAALDGSAPTARRALADVAELGARLIADPETTELAFDSRSRD